MEGKSDPHDHDRDRDRDHGQDRDRDHGDGDGGGDDYDVDDGGSVHRFISICKLPIDRPWRLYVIMVL